MTTASSTAVTGASRNSTAASSSSPEHEAMTDLLKLARASRDQGASQGVHGRDRALRARS